MRSSPTSLRRPTRSRRSPRRRRTPIGRAADAVATAIAADRRVFVASTSHVLHSELVMRAGGLAAVHALGEPPDFSQPMLDLRAGALEAIGPFQPEAGDVVLIGTNAGTDAGTVEVALAARAAGCVVVGLTCVAYEILARGRPRPSDTRAPDGPVGHPHRHRRGGRRRDRRRCPASTSPWGRRPGVALVAAAWAILVGAAERLLEQGLTPVAYRSVQIPGAEDLFHERRAAYEASGRGAAPAG